MPDKSPDVFLARLKTLAESFGGLSNSLMKCAFITGLPKRISVTIQTGAASEKLSLNDLLVRARMALRRSRSHSY